MYKLAILKLLLIKQMWMIRWTVPERARNWYLLLLNGPGQRRCLFCRFAHLPKLQLKITLPTTVYCKTEQGNNTSQCKETVRVGDGYGLLFGMKQRDISRIPGKLAGSPAVSFN